MGTLFSQSFQHQINWKNIFLVASTYYYWCPKCGRLQNFGFWKKQSALNSVSFLFLANVCSHSFLHLFSLWMDQNFTFLYKNKVIICFPLILFPSQYPLLQVSMPPKTKRRRHVDSQWSQQRGDDVALLSSKTSVRRFGISSEIHKCFYIYPHCTPPRFGLVKRVPHLVILFGTMSKGLGGTLVFTWVHDPSLWTKAFSLFHFAQQPAPHTHILPHTKPCNGFINLHLLLLASTRV